jgi:hypothetical protein
MPLPQRSSAPGRTSGRYGSQSTVLSAPSPSRSGSQPSPRKSPSASAWFGLKISGQLSTLLRTPSPSLSCGLVGPGSGALSPLASWGPSPRVGRAGVDRVGHATVGGDAAKRLAALPAPQVPQLPPQPSSPQVLKKQLGSQLWMSEPGFASAPGACRSPLRRRRLRRAGPARARTRRARGRSHTGGRESAASVPRQRLELEPARVGVAHVTVVAIGGQAEDLVALYRVDAGLHHRARHSVRCAGDGDQRRGQRLPVDGDVGARAPR